MFTKWFKRSALKVSTILLVSTAGFLGFLYLGYHYNVFQRFVPNDQTLLALVGFITVMFVWGLLSSIIRGRRIDNERRALLLVKDLMAENAAQKSKVDTILSGKMFEDAGLSDTRVAKFFANIARAKAVNPDYPVDIDRHVALMGDNLHDDLSGLMEGAASQTAYGFIGTLVGIVISLSTFDVSAVQEGAAEAAMILGVLMTGIGIAVLTTLIGLVSGTVLRKMHFYLEGKSITIVNYLKEMVMAEVEPLLNSNTYKVNGFNAKSGGSDNAS